MMSPAFGVIKKNFFGALRQRIARRRLSLKKSFRHELYRKSIHLSSLWIPALVYFAHTGISITLFSFLLFADGLIEYGNFKKWKWARRTFGAMFYKTLRSREMKKDKFQVSGSMYVFAAAIICTMLFAKPVAAIALTIMLTSDACAALFGKAFGTRKLYKSKSLEGTTAFFISALIIMMLFNPLYPVTYASILAAAVATFAEMFEDKIEIDDNLSVPLFVGVILSLLN